MAETIFNNTVKDTLEKAEAVQVLVKTVTMRAESLATSEPDFSKRLLDRREEAQKHLTSFPHSCRTVASAFNHAPKAAWVNPATQHHNLFRTSRVVGS